MNEVQVDIIIGSELTYSTLSVKNLTKVICKYLKPNGVFYEVLSNDRDVCVEFEFELIDFFINFNSFKGCFFIFTINRRNWIHL